MSSFSDSRKPIADRLQSQYQRPPFTYLTPLLAYGADVLGGEIDESFGPLPQILLDLLEAYAAGGLEQVLQVLENYGVPGAPNPGTPEVLLFTSDHPINGATLRSSFAGVSAQLGGPVEVPIPSAQRPVTGFAVSPGPLPLLSWALPLWRGFTEVASSPFLESPLIEWALAANVFGVPTTSSVAQSNAARGDDDGSMVLVQAVLPASLYTEAIRANQNRYTAVREDGSTYTVQVVGIHLITFEYIEALFQYLGGLLDDQPEPVIELMTVQTPYLLREGFDATNFPAGFDTRASFLMTLDTPPTPMVPGNLRLMAFDGGTFNMIAEFGVPVINNYDPGTGRLIVELDPLFGEVPAPSSLQPLAYEITNTDTGIIYRTPTNVPASIRSNDVPAAVLSLSTVNVPIGGAPATNIAYAVNSSGELLYGYQMAMNQGAVPAGIEMIFDEPVPGVPNVSIMPFEVDEGAPPEDSGRTFSIFADGSVAPGTYNTTLTVFDPSTGAGAVTPLEIVVT